MRLFALALAVSTVALAGAMVAACGEREHPPPLQNATPHGTGGDGGGDLFDAGNSDGPPPEDASGLCGNEIHPTITDAPNLYFVLDASGSMDEPEGSLNRYDAVRVAVADLIRGLGPLINVGAAVFPNDVSPADTCHVGGQVMPVSHGDPITGEDGPTTLAFVGSTAGTPEGGTPTAATLVKLAPVLEALPGRTIVLIATDGGPNCNLMASCSESECQANIEGQCAAGTNCCAPGELYGPASCIDRAATVAAIEAIHGAGIDVYVIGVDAGDFYTSVLDEMAVAGGVPQASEPRYFRVDDVASLSGVLASIASVHVSCDFQVENPPSEQGWTNVYLDQELLLYDPIDGWVWLTDSVIELRGDACARLKAGQVAEVQVVTGCPTEVPK